MTQPPTLWTPGAPQLLVDPIIRWPIGGREIEGPSSAAIPYQIDLAKLTHAAIAGELQQLVDLQMALCREVDRLRKQLGLPPWVGPETKPPPFPGVPVYESDSNGGGDDGDQQ